MSEPLTREEREQLRLDATKVAGVNYLANDTIRALNDLAALEKFLGQLASNIGTEITADRTEWMCAMEDAIAAKWAECDALRAQSVPRDRVR